MCSSRADDTRPAASDLSDEGIDDTFVLTLHEHAPYLVAPLTDGHFRKAKTSDECHTSISIDTIV